MTETIKVVTALATVWSSSTFDKMELRKSDI